ncbi:hypothetical protein A3C91_01310 [Candidatus Azambacteria bacterium RIFCSPHIGHO2_02_FULL_52_12]|uniref:Uncharacterized protein n=1 Tax=Candidatus Azambacteria bacterium RIFCSPLOWO2_01_FULL_46_25 TaxID=1797298 RepID=A0A1F5BV94_9BACT|nr:MAG: hypothetical protein A3C91_01310 [Candidatus Azambacteria bacterium RIFCSPHIGHO2_02_FULL_52_12]OGD34527.1 MAG: hypothetical protein A2988_03370 [Candidatus Azambacteria bacterium RIFCSPLOWO2_01_FULL_46_25]OGD36401.1 MAG: hypothetical protein A2850_01870 [Candidatus Azambacteria bacterium RIFCSPHIGHO2_01_FULL_51_74]
MKDSELIDCLNEYKEDVLEILFTNNQRHFADYFSIKNGFQDGNFAGDFKSDFCNFYILNGPGGMNNIQQKKFFELLSEKERDLIKILESLYGIPGYGNQRRLFLSFGTKLLHTINETLPIYDGNVAKVLGLSNQNYPDSREARIQNRVDIYNELKKRFDVLLENSDIRAYLDDIRRKLNTEYKQISNAKLLDSSLWALYTICSKPKKQNKKSTNSKNI